MDWLASVLDLRNAAFFGLALLSIGCALVVAFKRNIIHSTIALLGTFAGVAGLYVTLSADFLAAVQVLVYVGGTLTLILFAVMLTSKIEEVRVSNTSVGTWMAIPLVLVMLAGLAKVAWSTRWAAVVRPQTAATAALGHAFLSKYVLAFELASIILLAALIGAVVLARRAVRRRGEFETTEDLDGPRA